ncbi:MAG: BlaI/MecI/CopY family transcriptional regulator [Bacteroidaceae bacterium]
MKKITLQKEQVMLCFLEAGTSTVREIIGLLPDSDIPYTTIASIVNNLKRKSYLIASQNGNMYENTPLIAENEYKSTFMEGGRVNQQRYERLASITPEGICMGNFVCLFTNRRSGRLKAQLLHN